MTRREKLKVKIASQLVGLRLEELNEILAWIEALSSMHAKKPTD